MSAINIQGVVEQMRAMAVQAGAAPKSANKTTGTAGFGDVLQASMQRINSLQQTARSEAMDFQAGKPDIALQDVMIDTQEANLAFQMGVQMRNRLVGAYKEVMNMQV